MKSHFVFVALFVITLSIRGDSVGRLQATESDQFQEQKSQNLIFNSKSGFCGNGISYGPFRKGQAPGGQQPTKAQITEDLKILAQDGWQMIRTYGTEPFAKTVCEVIREERLPIKLMLGVWIETEQDMPEAKNKNIGQVEKAINLANVFKDVIFAVSVGNESQVAWSFHKVMPDTLIQYVRSVKTKISQPVTVADDFMYWKSEQSKKLAAEVDFIVTHIYAMWHGRKLDEALEWTKQEFKNVTKMHPGKVVVIGESGWATQKANHGDQGKLIKGKPGIKEQKIFFQQFTSWTKKEEIPYFYFEAFDEPWKGGNDPKEVEKHWGLFYETRTRKTAKDK